MKKLKKAFTLIEIMIWMLIVVVVLISAFEAYTLLLTGKIRLIEKTDMQKESFYFTEKFFQLVKWGWTLDYEEYFNRRVVWTETSSWHYFKETWFGNFWKDWNVWSENYWDWFYYCRSWDWTSMTATWGCYNNEALMANSSWTTIGLTWKSPQRYWEYSFQFIDYNSNYDDDLWNEDWTWGIIWDDDDEKIWNWPEAFSWSEVKELYLLSWDKKHRTFFRYTFKKDENAPKTTEYNCDKNSDWTWSWCLWNIEFLRLVWKDRWMDHNSNNIDNTQNDWVIDTWIIDPQFAWTDWSSGNPHIIAGSDNKNYWKKLFPDDINVTKFRVFAFPNIDSTKTWKESNPEKLKKINISPYVIINFSVKPSWKLRRVIKWEVRPLNFNTTVNLTEVFSK